MSYEISLNGNVESIEILSKSGSEMDVQIGDRKYHIDLVEVEEGVYSILHNGTSFNVELSRCEHKKYDVNTLYNNFEVEIIDAESRYMNSRAKHDEDEHQWQQAGDRVCL